MRRASLFLVAAAALAAAGIASAQEPAQPQPPVAQPRRAPAPSDDTLKDVYVMRRVLVREGFATTRVDAQNGLLIHARMAELNFAAGNGISSSGAEAYVVPGQGATFVLRTSDPVAPAADDVELPEEKAKPTVWDEEQDALDGKPREFTRRASPDRYDAAKVDGLRDRILEQLGKFGYRIRGLTASDSLTVIVLGGGTAGRTMYTDWAKVNGQQVPVSQSTVWTARPGADANTVLTIRVSFADCQAAGANSITLDEFRRRATTSQY